MGLDSVVVVVQIELMDLHLLLVGNMPVDLNSMVVIEQIEPNDLGLSYTLVENMAADLDSLVVIESNNLGLA